MQKIKLWWNAIPTFEMLTKKYANNNIWLSAILAVVWYGFAWILPYLLLESFGTTIVTICLKYLMIAVLMVILIRSVEYKWLKVLLSVGVVLQILLALNVVVPFGPGNGNANHGIKANTTYITYSDDCPYCEIAKTPMKRAIQVYNESHKNDIVLVDIEKSDKLSKALKPKIQYKGMVFVQVNSNETKQIPYTISKHGKPAKPSAAYVYNQIKKLE